MGEDRASFQNAYGAPHGGMDMLPKPTGARLPMLITGGSQQSPAWLAENGDGWMIYPRPTALQARVIGDWRSRTIAAGGTNKPVMQPLYFDLDPDPDALPRPIHLGFRSGVRYLRDYLATARQIGVNQVALNLRFNQADMVDTLKRLADDLLPDFDN